MAELAILNKTTFKLPDKTQLSFGRDYKRNAYSFSPNRRKRTIKHHKGNVYSKGFFKDSNNISKAPDEALRMYIAHRTAVDLTSSLCDMADDMMLAIIRGARNE